MHRTSALLEGYPQWQDDARCAGPAGRGIAFVTDALPGGRPANGETIPRPIRAALAVCAECPVTVECLRFGVETNSIGVWGGHWRDRNTTWRDVLARSVPA